MNFVKSHEADRSLPLLIRRNARFPLRQEEAHGCCSGQPRARVRLGIPDSMPLGVSPGTRKDSCIITAAVAAGMTEIVDQNYSFDRRDTPRKSADVSNALKSSAKRNFSPLLYQYARACRAF